MEWLILTCLSLVLGAPIVTLIYVLCLSEMNVQIKTDDKQSKKLEVKKS